MEEQQPQTQFVSKDQALLGFLAIIGIDVNGFQFIKLHFGVN